MRCRALLLLALVAMGAAPTPEQVLNAQRQRDADSAAQTAAEAQQQAAAADAQHAAEASVAAASRLRGAEGELARTTARVQELAALRDQADLRLRTDAAALAPLLPLMQRLSLYPAETLLAAPGQPANAVRGLLLLGGVARTLRERAEAVAVERAALQARQAQLDAALPGLQAGLEEQRGQSRALDALAARARQASGAAQDEAVSAAGRTAADAARAESLRAAVASFEAATPAEPRPAEPRRATAAESHFGIRLQPAPSRAAPFGGWVVPVAGSVARQFGAPGDAGPASGMTFRAPPGARVVAACGGLVVFAQPFRSYGKLVILDCGGGTHAVLAGLDRLDVQPGQTVRAGQPVGVMPRWDPSQAQAAGQVSGRAGELYVELRRGGQAIDPAPYLRAAM